MLESLLLTTLPAIATLIVTNIYNRSRYKAEIEKIIQEKKNSESDNFRIIFETYNSTLMQYKTELEDVNKRFSNYIKEANKRDQANRERIAKLEKDNAEMKQQLEKLLTSSRES